MPRSAILILCTTLALFGGLAAYALVDASAVRAASADELTHLSQEVTTLRSAVDETTAALTEARIDRRRLDLALESLQQRAQAVGMPAEGAPLSASPALGHKPTPIDDVTSAGDDVPAVADQHALERAEFLELLAAGVLDMQGTEEQQERFWEMTRTSPVLARMIGDLEAQVADSPEDATVRMQLADAYVAKLLTVPAGPERGVWGTKAENQWKAVAEADSQNWESRFALGENYSYYPAFLGKADEAISQLNAARAVQESRPAESRFVQTYLILARVHQSQGNVDAARAALQAGLQHHPGDPQLSAALQALP